MVSPENNDSPRAKRTPEVASRQAGSNPIDAVTQRDWNPSKFQKETEMSPSYKVMLAKQDHVEVISIYFFPTREQAERYLEYVFRGRVHAAFVFEADDAPNAELLPGFVWRWL